ncbi:hypothetical protein [Xenorhabdus sp. SGI246]|uniref:hypothetical protein n=1 Tax=Xenorhabdus sp. SGI246 TaxID=3158263 RepID=UPI00349F3AEC
MRIQLGHTWQNSGIAGLLGGHAGGRYLAMTPEMITTVVEAACTESLTFAKIAQCVEAKHGFLHCTFETLANSLKKQGLTYKRTRLSLKKVHEMEFAKKSALLNKIKAGAQLGHYHLIYFDEAGFSTSSPVQYG